MTLFESRSSVRRHSQTADSSAHVELLGSSISVDTSSSSSESSFTSLVASLSYSAKISKVDLFGEPSNDSEGAFSVSSGSRGKMNILVLPTNYADLPYNQQPHDQ